MLKKGEIKRQRIIDAANALFYEKGFAQTSLADIAEASGVPKGNFYFYFHTKDEILEAVIGDRLQRMRDRLAGWEEQHPDPLDRLRRLSEIMVRDRADIVRFGCPIGTLLLELGKQESPAKDHALSVLTALLSWAEAQFALIEPATAARRARQMVVRMQGAAVLANAFRDESWLLDEQRAIAEWLEGLTVIDRGA